MNRLLWFLGAALLFVGGSIQADPAAKQAAPSAEVVTTSQDCCDDPPPPCFPLCPPMS